LKETNSLNLLCQFLKDHYMQYIDMTEYIKGLYIVHDIKDIDYLSYKYEKTHTDIFLIPKKL